MYIAAYEMKVCFDETYRRLGKVPHINILFKSPIFTVRRIEVACSLWKNFHSTSFITESLFPFNHGNIFNTSSSVLKNRLNFIVFTHFLFWNAKLVLGTEYWYCAENLLVLNTKYSILNTIFEYGKRSRN